MAAMDAVASTKEVIFKAEGLTKIYRMGEVEVHALRGIDLMLYAGELVVLLGPSGSGKSTLLNLMAGLDRPTSGSLVVDGKRIDQMSEGQLANWRANSVGFVFQSYNLLPVLTAVENVELPLLLSPVPSSERRRRAETALKVVGLSERMGHYPRQLSGGQEQRVSIARAIVSDPLLIVADEPTGDLDRNSADEILKLLETLNQEMGKTIVMVTHDPQAAERAKIIRHLDKGKLK